MAGKVVEIAARSSVSLEGAREIIRAGQEKARQITLMQAILHDRLPIAKIVNATVIGLDEAPKSYKDFGRGAAKKYVLDQNGLVKKRAA